MWANLNLKSLQDKFQESLHDLESSLAAVAPPAVPPAASSSQPSSPSPATRRPQPAPVSTHQSPTRTNSGGIGLPLSPTSLSNAQQSASQLADSALSSLRASLRKGRQSFDAARASLDGGPASLTSPTARRTTSLDSVTSLTDSLRERELEDRDRGKGKGKLEELKEREEAEPVQPAPVVQQQNPEPEKVQAVEEEQEDEDAWGVGATEEPENEASEQVANTETTDPPVSNDLVDFSSPVESPALPSPPSADQPAPVTLSTTSHVEPEPSSVPSDPLSSVLSPSGKPSALPSSPPKPLVNPVLANLQKETLEATEDLTTDTPRPSTMGMDLPEPSTEDAKPLKSVTVGDEGQGEPEMQEEQEDEDGWGLPEVEVEAGSEEEELTAPEPVAAPEEEAKEQGTGEVDEAETEGVGLAAETEGAIPVAEPKKQVLDPLSEPFQPSFTSSAPSPEARVSEEPPAPAAEALLVEPEQLSVLPPVAEVSSAEARLIPDDVGPADYPEDIEDLADGPSTTEHDSTPNEQPSPDAPELAIDAPTDSHLGPVDPTTVATQGIELVEENVPLASDVPTDAIEPSDEQQADEQTGGNGNGVDDLLIEPEQPTVSQPETNPDREKLVLEEAEVVQEPNAIGPEENETQAEERHVSETDLGENERKEREEDGVEEFSKEPAQPELTDEAPITEEGVVNGENEESAKPMVEDAEPPKPETSANLSEDPMLEPTATSDDTQRAPVEPEEDDVVLDDVLGLDADGPTEPSVAPEPSEPIPALEPNGDAPTPPVDSAEEPVIGQATIDPTVSVAREVGANASTTEGPDVPEKEDRSETPLDPIQEPSPVDVDSLPTPTPAAEESASTISPPVAVTSLPSEESGAATPALTVLAASGVLDSSDRAEGSAAPNRPRSVSVSQDPRFVELSVAHDRLQTLKASLESLLSGLIPSISSIDDTEALGDELRNLKTKADLGMDEVRRMSGQLDQQKSRMEEVREMHRLEHQSQQSEIDALRDSLAARNASLEEANDKLGAAEKSAEATRQEIVKAAEEYDKLKIVAKEEEEKRVKALSLLRALRQKLVKNEQEKTTNDQELEKSRKAEKDALDTLKSDRARFDKEIVALRTAHEAQLTKLRTGFEREAQGLKERFEKEAISKRGQFELDAIHVKATQAKEISAKDVRIAQLEAAVKDLTKSRDQVFEEAQKKTEEIEATKSEEAVLRGRTSELEYELKEAKDRNAALADELEEVKRSKRETNRDDSNARKLLAETEARYEARIRDLETRSKQLEKDRHETEEEMGRNMQDRLKEVERMRAALAQKDLDYAESVQNSQKREAKIAEAEKARSELEKRLKNVEEMLKSVKDDADKAINAEIAVREELGDRVQRAAELETRLEEVQTKESTLRSNNKTLREELRKLQSGVLLSEKQRHPGVGYFSSFNSSSTAPNGHPGSPEPVPSSSRQVISPSGSVSSLASTATGGGLSGAARANGSADEALNFEYMRNVILQFLEKPEMRPHLISVLGVILHFTPAESRRLVAKAGH